MGLTLFEDFVYWTDGKSKSLRRAQKTTGAQGLELLNSWQAIKSIKVYHSLRQPEGNSLPILQAFHFPSHFFWPAPSRCFVSSWLCKPWNGLYAWLYVDFVFPSVISQCPSINVRWPMEAVATYVFCPRVVNTSVLVQLTSTWRLTIRLASPTAQPVRSADTLSHSPQQCKNI